MSPELPINIPESNGDESGSGYVRLERPKTLRNSLYLEILEGKNFTDTIMICQGGNVKVHGFLLAAASRFFQEIFESQGENYPFMRKILLPDFQVNEIKNLVELIYKGYVDLGSYKEAKDLKAALDFFGVSHVPLVGSHRVKENDRFEGSVKIKKSIKIPADIEAFKNSEPDNILIPKNNTKSKPKKISKVASHQPQPPMPSTSTSTTVNMTEPPKNSDNHHDHEHQPPPPKPSTSTSINVAENLIEAPKNSDNHHEPEPEHAQLQINKSGSHDDDDDIHEDDKADGVVRWKHPNYKDEVWFDEVFRRCVVCDKVFDCPGEAAKCLELNHKDHFRCYLCSLGYPGTETLFKHYALRHKPGLKQKSVECPYCKQTVAFHSLSSHVISLHFKSQNQDENEKQNVIGTHSPTPPPPKKAKVSNKNPGDGMLRVPNLDILIEHEFTTGKTFQLRLKKERLMPPKPK